MVERDVRVEVRSRFDGSWCRGFEIVGVLDDGESYRIRRVSDGVVLPVSIDADQAEKTAMQVGQPLAGWISFQPLYDWITAQQPELLDD